MIKNSSIDQQRAHLSILDGEQDEAVGVLLEEGLLGVTALELGALVLGDNDGVDGVLGGRVVDIGVIDVASALNDGGVVLLVGRSVEGVVGGRTGGRDDGNVAHRHALADGGHCRASGRLGLVVGGQSGHGRRDVVGLVEEGAGIGAEGLSGHG